MLRDEKQSRSIGKVPFGISGAMRERMINNGNLMLLKSRKTKTYDNKRTEFIRKYGYEVVRITNRDVIYNIEGVLEYLLSLRQKRGEIKQR